MVSDQGGRDPSAWLALGIAALTFLGLLAAAVRRALRVIVTAWRAAEDWRGTDERPGVMAQLGALEASTLALREGYQDLRDTVNANHAQLVHLIERERDATQNSCACRVDAALSDPEKTGCSLRTEGVDCPLERSAHERTGQG